MNTGRPQHCEAGKRERRTGRPLLARDAVREGERGQAMVEFVLVLPVLLLILFGVAQFGLALNSANDETHVANLVARYATVDENPATGGKTLQSWGKEQLDQNALKSGATVCISFPSGEEVGSPVKVEVTSKISPLKVFKLFGAVEKALSTSVKGVAYMRLEAPPGSVYKAGCE